MPEEGAVLEGPMDHPRSAPPLGPRFRALLTEGGANDPAPLGLLRWISSY
jgi:hypothetical protein